MDVNDTLSDEQFVQDVTSSFFDWIWDELLPVLLLVLFLILFVFGILINTTLLVVAGRNSWYKEPVHAFIIQLSIVDLLACAFVVLPTLVSVRRDGPAFPDTTESCNFQYVMFTLCLILTFIFISIGVIERAMRAVSTRVYVRCFGNPCCVILVVITAWFFGFIICFFSLVDQDLDYDEDLYHCLIRFDKNPALMNFLFAIWYYLPIVVVVVCFGLIFYQRNHDIKENLTIKSQKDKDFRNSGVDLSVSFTKERTTSVFYVNKPRRHEYPHRSTLYTSNAKVACTLAGDETDAGNILKSHRRQLAGFDAKKKWKDVVRRVTERKRIVQIFRDKPDDINHHQAMTYLLTWITMTICWLVYVIAQYINVYSDRCDTCLSVGVLIGQSTYSCKPLIYIAHNRWYRSTCLGTIKACCKKDSVDDSSA